MITRWCIAFIIIFMGLFSICWYFDKYRKYKYGCLEKISFQKFLEIYNNASHKVSLNEGYFYYSPEMSGSAYTFYFSIPDTFRYEHWRKVRERQRQEERKNYKLNVIEAAWEKDAEQHKEKEMKNGN